MLVLDIVLVVAMGLMIVALLAMKMRMDEIVEKYNYLFRQQVMINANLLKEAEQVHCKVKKLEQNCPKIKYGGDQ